MESLAVVTVNNANRHPIVNNCNPLGGGGGQGVVGGVGLVNGPGNCLEVVTGVEGLDLLVAAQQTQQQGLAPVAIVKSIVNPRQLHNVHTLPIVASPTSGTAVLLNPVAIAGLNSGMHGGSSNSGLTTNNNNNNSTNNPNNLNNLMQLTGDQILTTTTTAATTITTVKIEPSALVQQQQQPVPGQLHPAANPTQQQQQPAMTNKRNRMEV